MQASSQPPVIINIGQAFRSAIRQYPLWLALLAVGVIVFFGAPGGYGETSYALLHGLCAQTPSHTFHFGDKALPFDARMTGIYSGFAVTFLGLAITRRLFFYGDMPRSVIALLVLLLLGMAADGTNSLLTDLNLWHPWTSSNALRLVTGYGVGVGLAVVLAWLLASSTWHLSRPTTGVESIRNLWFAPVGLLFLGLLLLWSPSWLHLPYSVVLVLAAWAAVTLLVLVSVLLAFRLDESVKSFARLHVPVAISGLLAVSIMIGLGSFRFWIERTFGISNALW